jgi:hypothetical protein
MFQHLHHRPIVYSSSAHLESFQGQIPVLPQLFEGWRERCFSEIDELVHELEWLRTEGLLDAPGTPEQIGDNWKGAVLHLLEVKARASLFDDPSMDLGQFQAGIYFHLNECKVPVLT